MPRLMSFFAEHTGSLCLFSHGGELGALARSDARTAW